MNVFTRVEPDDPNRCQGVGQSGQCPFRAMGNFDRATQKWEGSKYCPRHCGVYKSAGSNPADRRLYLAALWKDRIGEQADHPKLKSVREEIGILRMTLNTKLESLHDDQELLMHAGQITMLVQNIEKLVRTCSHIEIAMGAMLDKAQALAFVQDILAIISKHITDPEILANLSEEMIASLERRVTV